MLYGYIVKFTVRGFFGWYLPPSRYHVGVISPEPGVQDGTGQPACLEQRKLRISPGDFRDERGLWVC